MTKPIKTWIIGGEKERKRVNKLLQTFAIFWHIDNLWARSKWGNGVKLEWIGGTGADGERFLRGFGVRVWGRQIAFDPGDAWGVRVRKEQAAYADALLRVKGFAVVSRPLGKKFKTVPVPWGVPAKPVGITGFLIRLIGGDLDPLKDEGWGRPVDPEKRGSKKRKPARNGNTRRAGSTPRKSPEKRVTRVRGAYRRGV